MSWLTGSNHHASPSHCQRPAGRARGAPHKATPGRWLTRRQLEPRHPASAWRSSQSGIRPSQLGWKRGATRRPDHADSQPASPCVKSRNSREPACLLEDYRGQLRCGGSRCTADEGMEMGWRTAPVKWRPQAAFWTSERATGRQSSPRAWRKSRASCQERPLPCPRLLSLPNEEGRSAARRASLVWCLVVHLRRILRPSRRHSGLLSLDILFLGTSGQGIRAKSADPTFGGLVDVKV